MRIEHIALWTTDLDRCQAFYVKYFGARAGAPYANPAKGFESRFLSFAGGARLELRHTTSSVAGRGRAGRAAHGSHVAVAISVDSEREVGELTQRLRNDGYPVLDRPRRTGDGYYESVVLDPDGNRIEG